MTISKKPTQTRASCNALCSTMLARYYSDKPVSEGELLASGWRLGKTEQGDIEFARTLGGQGTPFVTYDLSVEQRGSSWIPMHGSIKMAAESTPENAANAVLRYWHDLPLRDKLTAQSYQALQAKQKQKRASVYLLAELCLGDDAYGENLPVAGLFRFTEETLQKADKVVRLIKEGVLSGKGAHVPVSRTDVAWLSCVGFTKENTLASVPGFFDSATDHVIFMCDAADMEIDEERAAFSEECVPHSPTHDCVKGRSGFYLEEVEEKGLMASATGEMGSWTLHGYLQSWAVLREKIAEELGSAECCGSCDVASGHVSIDRDVLRLLVACGAAHIEDVESGIEERLYSEAENADLPQKQAALEAAQATLGL